MITSRRALRRAVRRRTPVAFWHFGREHLVVATLRAGDDEPVLLACAAVRAEWLGGAGGGTPLCPGVLELSRQVSAGVRLHAAALATECESVDADAVEVEVSGGQRVLVSRTRIDHVVELFYAVRLPLVTLESESSARDHLARFFGPTAGRRPGERSLAEDPLAAVSVTPSCECAAAALGKLLCVPVGLALASFGVSEDA